RGDGTEGPGIRARELPHHAPAARVPDADARNRPGAGREGGDPVSTVAGMRVLVPDLDVDRFFASLRASSDRALVLDYDGTLAPFHEDPAQAKPWPKAMALVAGIIAEGRTRVVIATGRWTRDLLPLLDLPKQPELWGSH